jgi:hypothetical protein
MTSTKATELAQLASVISANANNEITVTSKLLNPVITDGSVDGTTIGATTPSTIAGTTGSFSGDLTIADKIVHSGDTNTAIRFPAADTVTVETNGSERVRVNSSGNLGLGVVPSAWATGNFIGLQVGKGASIVGRGGAGTEDQIYVSANAYNDGSWKYIGTGNASNYYQDNGEHVWRTAPSGTAGNAITFTEAMRITSAGNVGIGVTPSAWTSPDKILQFGAAGVLRANAGTSFSSFGANFYSDGAFKYINTAAASRYDQFAGEHLWYSAPSGTAGNAITFTERMRIDSAGNVGIGVTPSAWSGGGVKGLEAYNGSQNGFIVGFSDNSYQFGTNAYYNNSWKYKASNAAANYYQQNGVHIWRNAASGTADNTITWSERMRIDSAGNVGIGTASPADKLHLLGSGETGLRIDDSGTARYAEVTFGTTNAAMVIGSQGGSPYPITFETDSTERMRIDSSGNLLVNKTTTATTGAGHYLSADGAASHTRASNPALAIRRDTTDGQCTIFLREGTQVGSISVTGSATSYTTSSDYRLKENVEPMQNALDTVAQLNPVTYTWKADGSSGQGFIAHELQAVVPDCVTGEKDAVDADGNPQYQGVDTSFLVATLVKAVQELSAKIKELENK